MPFNTLPCDLEIDLNVPSVLFEFFLQYFYLEQSAPGEFLRPEPHLDESLSQVCDEATLSAGTRFTFKLSIY